MNVYVTYFLPSDNLILLSQSLTIQYEIIFFVFLFYIKRILAKGKLKKFLKSRLSLETVRRTVGEI